MIDSHIHLNDEQYDEILEQVVAEAKNAGVKKVVLIGCEESDFNDVITMKESDPEFYIPVCGIHPVYVESVSSDWYDKLEYLCEDGKISGIGEIGLDYHWHPEQEKIQKEIFIKQLKLAKKYDLPIVVHSRDAYEDCLEILKSFSPIKGVMHSFAGSQELAFEFVKIGMHIGLSGPITFKNGQSQRDVAKVIPLSSLLIETDGPYLTPVPYRGKINKPEYIVYVAEEIAFQKQVSVDEVLKKTEFNTKKLFGEL